MTQSTTGLVSRLKFALRDWNRMDRFHFPSINALVIDEAITHLESHATIMGETVDDVADHNILFVCDKRRNIIAGEDGINLFFPDRGEAYNADNLRAIARELDRRNVEPLARLAVALRAQAQDTPL